MPIVLLSRLTSNPLPPPLAGVDLVLTAASLAAEDGSSLYLLGAAPDVAAEAASALQARYPALEIAGTYSPPVGQWSMEEDNRIVERIRAARPQYLFVALGAPR